MPESPLFNEPQLPEAMPSTMAIAEPTTARFFGMIGFGCAAVGALALALNNYGPRLVGPNLATVMALFGIAAMLFHAVRDDDQLVRRCYIALGIALLGMGVALSAVPSPSHVGDRFFPWGILALIGGLLFALGAGRHENEPPWSAIIPGFLSLIGAALLLGGAGAIALGIKLPPDYLPRCAGMAIVGLAFWWAAIARLDPDTPAGFRWGRVLTIIGLVGLAYAIVRSAIPAVMLYMESEQPASRFFMPYGLTLGALSVMAILLGLSQISDRPLVAMTRRELGAYFFSPIAYIVLFGSAVIGWLQYWFFVSGILLSRNSIEPIVQQYSIDFLPVFGVIFIIPVVTMRLVSEETRTGTMEVLLTSPVSEWQVVWSKFIAGLIYFLVVTLPWGLFLIPIYMEGVNGFDYFPLMSLYLAVASTGAAFVAMGVFCSSLTRNQIIAAALSFAGMIVFFAFFFLDRRVSVGEYRAVIEQLSFVGIWISAVGGRLQLHQIVTYLSLAAFWLFLTVKVLESRKWT